MGGLRLAGITLLLGLAAPIQAQGAHRWDPYVREASRRFAIPEAWIRRVIGVESGGLTRVAGRPVRSSAGAMGLMQLMPRTWAEIRDELGLGPDPDDPRDNILAGTFYLRSLYDRFGYPGLFAAYHSGPGRYSKFLAGRAPLPSQTVAYLDRVAGERERPERPAGIPIFAVKAVAERPATTAGAPVARDEAVGLFVRLSEGKDRANN